MCDNNTWKKIQCATGTVCQSTKKGYVICGYDDSNEQDAYAGNASNDALDEEEIEEEAEEENESKYSSDLEETTNESNGGDANEGDEDDEGESNVSYPNNHEDPDETNTVQSDSKDYDAGSDGKKDPDYTNDNEGNSADQPEYPKDAIENQENNSTPVNDSEEAGVKEVVAPVAENKDQGENDYKSPEYENAVNNNPQEENVESEMQDMGKAPDQDDGANVVENGEAEVPSENASPTEDH
ncbi:hypothetical protein K493DRAFT_346202 [Basidiobolus meristosporus CBS 931.73]|uniref:Uncharacterized protein n=1 Tax=Basidiobolus meristosporus CBS 931.73 TaxID=1314790 RepID=A0A1Y1YZA6_9FUNG|nr:hypothetical protein K493DRAFT_362712 [Basidiobolus meristosporus CBS 931.73]ORY03372.1 hypothetical protein K493DRAFT_346202 [Basidiobolus meristosporus CBS 931.73]|eukprot:ORX79135.1 hypothetical protein K493DRAFT_362712 [Basidiobolus meristosporus CBS 931.73]